MNATSEPTPATQAVQGLKYPVLKKKPVARFYYKGQHTHPVRRTILLTEITPTLVRGYELREGSEVRDAAEAPIKSFRKDRIALLSQLGARKHREPGPEVTSLKRESLLGLVVAAAWFAGSSAA